MKKAIVLIIILFASCDKDMDMTIKQFMSYDLPHSCKMAYICWKTRGKIDEKSACEKYSITCSDALKDIDQAITKKKVYKILHAEKYNQKSFYSLQGDR